MVFPTIIPAPTTAAQWNTVYTGSLTTLQGTQPATTMVQKVLKGSLKATGTSVRITSQPLTSGSCILTEVWIGLVATSGNAYNFDGNQVQVFFNGGSPSVTLDSSATTSDDIVFTIDESTAVIIAANMSIGSRYMNRVGSLISTNFILYRGLGTSSAQAGTTLKTVGTGANGYTAGSSPNQAIWSLVEAAN